MAPQPPRFASREYWESRFQQNEQPFDWLQPASYMDPQITEALSCRPESCSEILHIGSGTSLLSFHLRAHVEDPSQIHNVDFSAKAIEWGAQNETAIFHEEQGGETQETTKDDAYKELGNDADKMMRWSQVSLLSQSSVLSACSESSYAVIVDKSTVDAIACGDDVEVSFKTRSDCNETCLHPPGRLHNGPSYFVHPVCILALHLALIATPGCRWISLSYSSARFQFFHNDSNNSTESEEYVPCELLEKGYPNPALYWRLISKEAVDAPGEESNGAPHRPRLHHWLYVLERTNEDLRPW